MPAPDDKPPPMVTSVDVVPRDGKHDVVVRGPTVAVGDDGRPTTSPVVAPGMAQRQHKISEPRQDFGKQVEAKRQEGGEELAELDHMSDDGSAIIIIGHNNDDSDHPPEGCSRSSRRHDSANSGSGSGSSSAKARKKYVLTRRRQYWTPEEHERFVTALAVHGRQWKAIEASVGSKTAVQIRSHAQKYFLRLDRAATAAATAVTVEAAAAAAAESQNTLEHGELVAALSANHMLVGAYALAPTPPSHHYPLQQGRLGLPFSAAITTVPHGQQQQHMAASPPPPPPFPFYANHHHHHHQQNHHPHHHHPSHTAYRFNPPVHPYYHTPPYYAPARPHVECPCSACLASVGTHPPGHHHVHHHHHHQQLQQQHSLPHAPPMAHPSVGFYGDCYMAQPHVGQPHALPYQQHQHRHDHHLHADRSPVSYFPLPPHVAISQKHHSESSTAGPVMDLPVSKLPTQSPTKVEQHRASVSDPSEDCKNSSSRVTAVPIGKPDTSRTSSPSKSIIKLETPSKRSFDQVEGGLNATVALFLSAGKQLEARSTAPRPPLPPRRSSPSPDDIGPLATAPPSQMRSRERGSPVTSDDGNRPPKPTKSRRTSRVERPDVDRAVPEKSISNPVHARLPSVAKLGSGRKICKTAPRKSQAKMATLWAVATASVAQTCDDSNSSCSSDGTPIVPERMIT
jgi:SHAQKYF class myb-like DNA-binding protein